MPNWLVVSNIFYFHPNLGKMNPFWRAYFSDGLVQPPTSQSRGSIFCWEKTTPKKPLRKNPIQKAGSDPAVPGTRNLKKLGGMGTETADAVRQNEMKWGWDVFFLLGDFLMNPCIFIGWFFVGHSEVEMGWKKSSGKSQHLERNGGICHMSYITFLSNHSRAAT